MVDITPYKERLTKTKVYESPSDNPRGDFLDHLNKAGFKAPKILRDGVIDRIGDPTDKGGKESGWYIYHQYEHIAIASYGTWKDAGVTHTWTSKEKGDMSFAERVKMNEAIKKNEEKRREELRVKQENAALSASKEYLSLDDATDENPYLKKKGVKACEGLKVKGDILYMPILDDGVIQSYQKIMPDSSKRMKIGGRKKGCYFVIDGAENNIFISEGLSTGLSVNEATGAMVYVAIDCSNLYEVAQKVKLKHTNALIRIAGENNDANKSKCAQIDLDAVFPPEKTHDDFNDMHVAYGIDAVSDVLNQKPKETKKEKTKKLNTPDFKLGGVLDEIVDYYNATSGNDQPLFAIQTAIATCSVLLGRNFITNYSNKSALYMLNLAKSATGKEHGKKVIEKILEETENGHLIGGDGYTSGSAVLSALQYRPRHLTVIDEFSKSLEMSNNKNSNGQLKEANHKLMEVIGRLDGTIRPRAYSMVGMTKAKMQEMSEQKIVSPHITLVAMSTPADFFKNISQDAIKDGFINRFIVCLSDTPRTLRQHMARMEVPQTIIDWDLKIKERTGNPEDFAEQTPNEIILTFTFDAIKEQEKFQQKCIDLSNELEVFGMEELTGRSNEMAMRLALIIALSRNPMTDKIEKDDMISAIEWINFNLTKMIDKLKMSVSGSEFESHKKEILQALRDKATTWSSMQKRPPFSKHKPKDLKEILQSLKDSDLIIDTAEEKSGKGRPSVLWTAS